MASNEAYGRRSVVFESKYNAGTGAGNFSFAATRTTFNTTSVPGDETRSLPVVVGTSMRNSRLKLEKRHAVTHSKGMQISVAFLRINPVEVRHQRTQQEGASLRLRRSSCHGSGHHLPATTATSLWASVIEIEDERENVEEPSHAERPLAPFLRPPWPPPELRPLPWLLDQGCPLAAP